MVKWEISRHPEWDLMFRAGLTVREISDYCHANVDTVHRHVVVREKYELDYRAEHETAFQNRDLDHPTPAWLSSLGSVQSFLSENSRLPGPNGNEKELILHKWLNRQRNKYNRNRMSPQKTVLLDKLPGWKVSYQQQSLDKQWSTRLEELADYLSQFGRAPRYRNYADDHEHKLGVWLHVQHQRRANGTLRSDRLLQLDNIFPGWCSKY